MTQKQKTFDEAAEEFYNGTGIKIYPNHIVKNSVEFSRYKQDCRKRALELAQSQMPTIYTEGDWLPSGELIIALADKYYNWLKSIPE